MSARFLLPGALLLCLPLSADIVHLKSGGQLDGWVRCDTEQQITIETRAGIITVQRAEIASIDLEHESKIEAFYQMWDTFRRARVAEGFCFLARWCEDEKLDKFVPMVRRACLEVDPRHDFEHKGPSEARGSPGDTELKPEADPRPEIRRGEVVHKPKPPKKPRPLKITVAPTWVAPLAKIRPDGGIVYPINSLPNSNSPFDDAFAVPYWGIPPKGLEQSHAAEDFARARKEFSNEGLMQAIMTWRIVQRERDILLIPPNEGDTRRWRLIYSLAPGSLALAIVQGLRSGQTPGAQTGPAPAPAKQEPERPPARAAEPDKPLAKPQPGNFVTKPEEAAPYLKHADPEMRRLAAEVMGANVATTYADAVAKLLKDPDKGVRRAAAWALGSMGARRFAPDLAELLKDEDPLVRQAAARSLGAVGTRDQLHALQDASDGEKAGYVRLSMEQAISSIKNR
jgi:hypothetical protein